MANKFLHVDCTRAAPLISIQGSDTTLGADASVANVAPVGSGMAPLEIRYEQANADINFKKVIDANSTSGWQVPNDNTDNDGAEVTGGILSTDLAFVAQTDSFSFEVKFGIPDVSDYDVFAIGFREAGAYVDAINTPAALAAAYDEKALLNVNAGDIYSITSLAGSDTATDTTDNWADDAVKTLKVAVSSAGVVTFTIDGAAPTVDTNTLTFAADTVLVPCIIYCKGAAVADTPPIINYLTAKLA